MSNDLLHEFVRRRAEDDAVIALPEHPTRTDATVFAVRETAIIAGAGFLIFVVAAALLFHFLVP